MALDWDETAFTTDQVVRLTGITKRKLEYWIRRRLFSPEIQRGKGRGRVRLFSFANLLEIRAAVWLRDKVSLQLIRKIVERLREEGLQRPLKSVTFGVVEYPSTPSAAGTEHRKVEPEVVIKRHDGSWESSRHPRQIILQVTVPIAEFAESLKESASRDRARRKAGRIERRRGVLGSTPVVAGTRIPTRAIRALREAGYDTTRILANYPGLQEADVEAALNERLVQRAKRSRPA